MGQNFVSHTNIKGHALTPAILRAYAAKRLEKAMSIPESVIREMKAFHRDSCYPECGNESAADATRRVILALAEEMPADAVDAFIRAFWLMPPGWGIEQLFGSTVRLTNERERAIVAIAAFLKHVAGDSP